MYFSILYNQCASLFVCLGLYVTVPTAAPQNVNVDASASTSISLSWDPPPLPHRNGRIQNYNIYVHEVETGTQTQHTSTNLLITIYSLHPYYSYKCKVAAYTIGEGNRSQPVTIVTDEASKCAQMTTVYCMVS